MNEVDAVALKPCPFCGGAFKMGKEPHDNLPVNGMYYIYHDYGPIGSAARKCPIEVKRHFGSVKEAIAAWNTRAALDAARGDQVARVVEWLRNGGGTDISQLNGSMQMLFLKGMNRYADAIEQGEPFNG